MNVKRILLCTIIFMVIITSLTMASAELFDFENDYNNQHYEAYTEVLADNVSFSVVDYDSGTPNEFYVSSEDDQYYYGHAVKGDEAKGEYNIKFKANLSNLDWEIKPSDGYDDGDLNKTSIKKFLNEYFKNNFEDNYDEEGYWNWSISRIGDDRVFNGVLENGILSVNAKFAKEGSIDYTEESITIFLNNKEDDALVMINVKMPEDAYESAYNLPNDHGDDGYVSYNLNY